MSDEEVEVPTDYVLVDQSDELELPTDNVLVDQPDKVELPTDNVLVDQPETQELEPSQVPAEKIAVNELKTKDKEMNHDPLKTPSKCSQDYLNLEFFYYCSVLKTAALTLSSDEDKKIVTPWIRRLLRPEYQTTLLRKKRNQYLAVLVLNLLIDEIDEFFCRFPSEGPLPDIEKMQIRHLVAAEWETDPIWHDTLLSIPKGVQIMACSVHKSRDQCANDHKIDRILDQEFQFLLYLARPYAAMLSADDRSRTAVWLQTLCTIYGESCSSMKSIRNDYITALLGYLHDLRIVGPFTDYPPTQLERLDVATAKWAENYPVLDPESSEMDSFLSDQPVPDDGAFCYVTLTGDLISSSM